MDIFISNVSPQSNQIELHRFLRDVVQKFGILAFKIMKPPGKNWAILTVADPDNARRFLQTFGGQRPRDSLHFKELQLQFKKSEKKGQPDKLKVRVLMEEESTMRANQSRHGTIAKTSQSSEPIISFITFQTGVWEYDRLGKLVFDSKHKDMRKGTLTCGRSALVVDLAAGVHQAAQWRCRIDIPYSTIEHVITSDDNGIRGSIAFTLKSPPKIYRMPDLGALSLRGRAKGSVRETSIMPHLDKNSALCMVYRFVLPDIDSTQHAWAYISNSSALRRSQAWKTMAPSRKTDSIEAEYQKMEKDLSSLNDDIARYFTFAVRFQVLALVLEATITPEMMTRLIPHVKTLSRHYGPEHTARGVRKLQYQIPTPGPDVTADEWKLDHVINTLTQNVQDYKNLEETAHDLMSKQTQHHHLVMTYKATVTPTGLLLRGPDATVSNRVLRKYADKSEYFLRVFFADEDGLSVFHDPRASQDRVYARFRKCLQDGITIAGRQYKLLGFSHSSLRSHTAWFMAPFAQDGKPIQSERVIEDLGDFSHIHCSAKCAARIGQAFSDTIFAVPVTEDVYVIEMHPDVERNGRCFSDGCGTISLQLLEKIWSRLPPEHRKLRPKILQIRYRGAKGVVSLDTSLTGKQLLIRKSMTKYNARESWRDLEICDAAYKPRNMFLNHQFIKILEDLGIPHQNFVDVQKDALHALELAVKHPVNAASLLAYSHSGVSAKTPILLTLMDKIGLSFQADRFLTDIVEIAAMSSLRDLKYRARIPIHKGHLLFGIMDETNELREGEVYIATGQQDEFGHWRRQTLVRDRLVVTRTPALHPGDVQVVKAVDVPESSPLRDLDNCIVFSQQGERDLPSQLGGGDLDGDSFYIIYDERLIPPMTRDPSDYPPTAAEDLGRPVKVDDVVNFFIEYMKSDRLGQISTKHKIRADKHQEGTAHPDCITLAQLASDAVDFGKSGKVVNMERVPDRDDHLRPDFMANSPGLILNNQGAAELKEEDVDDIDNPDSIDMLDPEKLPFRYYKSNKILGVLYRQIGEANFISRMKNDFKAVQNEWGEGSLIMKLQNYVDRETKAFQWEHHRDFAEELREYYEDNMLQIMDSLRPHRGKPLTELEVFSGNILGKKERASTSYIREANLEVQERFNRDVTSITKRILRGDGLRDEGDEENEALPRAIACFKISLETKGWEKYGRLKSWRYVTAAVCLEQLWRSTNFKLRRV